MKKYLFTAKKAHVFVSTHVLSILYSSIANQAEYFEL